MDFLKRSISPFFASSATDDDLETLLKSEDNKSLFTSKHALPTTASRIIKKFVVALLPDPIQRYLAPHLYKPSRIHRTSYLDGLRGTCIHHHVPEFGPLQRSNADLPSPVIKDLLR